MGNEKVGVRGREKEEKASVEGVKFEEGERGRVRRREGKGRRREGEG